MSAENSHKQALERIVAAAQRFLQHEKERDISEAKRLALLLDIYLVAKSSLDNGIFPEFAGPDWVTETREYLVLDGILSE